jgi:hypothetical protein
MGGAAAIRRLQKLRCCLGKQQASPRAPDSRPPGTTQGAPCATPWCARRIGVAWAGRQVSTEPDCGSSLAQSRACGCRISPRRRPFVVGASGRARPPDGRRRTARAEPPIQLQPRDGAAAAAEQGGVGRGSARAPGVPRPHVPRSRPRCVPERAARRARRASSLVRGNVETALTGGLTPGGRRSPVI